MNTKQLHYLVTIADYGNLSHAAQALGISQPALSKSLAEWEATYGFSLFLRYRRQLTPTAVGRYLIECAHKILDVQNRMMLTMRAVTGGKLNHINLATAPNRGAIIYSRIYNQFSRRYPDIALNLTELYANEQPGAVSRGQVDLALGSGNISDIVTDIPIAQEELLVSLPVSHPLAGQQSIRLEDLWDVPFVLQGKRHSIRIIAERLFAEAGFEPVVAFESDDVMLLDSMMHQAVGAGFVSQAHVFPCDELVYLPLDPPVYQTLHIRYPLGHTLTQPEQYLSSLLIRERLNDPRYSAIHSPEADALFEVAAEPGEEVVATLPRQAAVGNTVQKQEISFDSKILEYLIAIVEEQSLTKAADRFYLAAPALSRHLRNVENTVGMPLFARDHNRLQPNNAGKVFVNGARNMLHIETEMNQHINAYRKGHGGRLFVHCDSTLAPLLETNVLEPFAKRHPDVLIKMVEGNSEDGREALLNASSDLGLLMTCEPKHPQLIHQVLAQTELVYCADAADLLQGVVGGDPLPENLPPRKIMLEQEGSTLRGQQERLLPGWEENSGRVVCEANAALLQKLAVIGGGDTILPLHILPKAARAHCYSLTPPQPYYLTLAWNASRTLPPSAKALMELIRAEFQDFFF